MEISFEESTLSKNNNCAWMILATWSLIPVPKKIILSIIKREKTSIATAFN